MWENVIGFVSSLLSLLGGLRVVRARGGENCPYLSIHTQNIPLRARDSHESYDHALGIFIANTGNSPIHIQRAMFRDRVPLLGLFETRSSLPIYPAAFRDAECDAYELKFGEQWYDPQVDISPRNRVMTYLPLSRPVPDGEINRRRHGQVILRYSSEDRAGTHRVYV